PRALAELLFRSRLPPRRPGGHGDRCQIRHPQTGTQPLTEPQPDGEGGLIAHEVSCGGARCGTRLRRQDAGGNRGAAAGDAAAASRGYNGHGRGRRHPSREGDRPMTTTTAFLTPLCLLVAGTLLSAGTARAAEPPAFTKKTYTYKTAGEVKIQADVYRADDD